MHLTLEKTMKQSLFLMCIRLTVLQSSTSVVLLIPSSSESLIISVAFLSSLSFLLQGTRTAQPHCHWFIQRCSGVLIFALHIFPKLNQFLSFFLSSFLSFSSFLPFFFFLPSFPPSLPPSFLPSFLPLLLLLLWNSDRTISITTLRFHHYVVMVKSETIILHLGIAFFPPGASFYA